LATVPHNERGVGCNCTLVFERFYVKMKHYIILYILSIFLSSTGARLVAKYGRYLKLLDKPNARSSHRTVTPKGGGVGILAAFIVVAITLKMPVTFWIPAVTLSVISFFGDRFEISPLFRLMFQFAAGLIFLTGIWKGQPTSSLDYLMILPLSVFIVATANYYNFMDGINGIAGITGVVGFGLLSFYSFSSGANPSTLALNICLSLCCLGFLPFNVPRAKVFMGDVGSVLLGFVFATTVIGLSKSFLDFICLASFLFPFYADEISTEFTRLKDAEKLWTPHRRHFYQLLANEYGIPHWKVSLGYGLGQFFVGASILAFMNAGLLAVLSIIFLYFFIFTLVTNALRKRLIHKSSP